MTDAEAAGRNYLMSGPERFRRHLRVNGRAAMLGAISTSGIAAGFLSATGRTWPLLAYVLLTIVVALAFLAGVAVSGPRVRFALLVPGLRGTRPAAGRPVQLPLVAATPRAPVREVDAGRCDDPVYGAGLRALLVPSNPIVVVATSRRDVGKPEELLFPLFKERRRRSRVEVDLGPFGIPIRPYVLERDLPDGAQDTDHSLAVRDLVYVPELAAALDGTGSPFLWPEHCVDPGLLADRDVIVVGGPDTNFWHAALFEAVTREFAAPPSTVPLAMSLREQGSEWPVYGSRSLHVRSAGLHTVFPHTHDDGVDLDERLYPAYGMVLACRNPFAAALGRSRWCVFVAGTRSLGTSGTVLALTMMLTAMRADPDVNFATAVPTAAPGVSARVSAVLVRTVEVEQAALRRSGTVTRRRRRRLPPDGLDPQYSDTYLPSEVEYLSYDRDVPSWRRLGSLARP